MKEHGIGLRGFIDTDGVCNWTQHGDDRYTQGDDEYADERNDEMKDIVYKAFRICSSR